MSTLSPTRPIGSAPATAAELLNDAEINYLADLYLARFYLDRRDRDYRRLRNAVILTSKGLYDFNDICSAIAETEQKTSRTVADGIKRAIGKMPRPAHILFNEAFAQSEVMSATALTMPPHKDPADVVSFLGTAFLYIRLVNYNDPI